MKVLPFPAFVGLEELKEALLYLAIDNNIGGLLIFGPKGTGKSSIVRAFADVLPSIKVVKGCPFNDDPDDPSNLCYICKENLKKYGKLDVEVRKMKVVTLPIGATEDMVLGTINIERSLKKGRTVFEPGILARANRNILYIDEVNLLPDHIVDSILDAAASGWNIVEREGISLMHPSKFILIGTMNPEEGELRPQLLDRFAISVKVTTISDPELRKEIIKRNLEFESNSKVFYEKWQYKIAEVRERIKKAKEVLKEVTIDEEALRLISGVCSKLEVDGYRPDIVAAKIAKARAALYNRKKVSYEDILVGLKLALGHRTRAGGLKPPATLSEIQSALSSSLKVVSEKVERREKKKTKRKRESPGMISYKNIFSFNNLLKRGLTFKKGSRKISNKKYAWLSMIFIFVSFFALLMIDIRMALLALAIYLLLSMLLNRRGIYGAGYVLKASNKGMLVSFDDAISPGSEMLPIIERGFKILPEKFKAPFLIEMAISAKSKKARNIGRERLKALGKAVDYKVPKNKSIKDIAWAPSLRRSLLKGKKELSLEDLRENIRIGRGRISLIVVLDSSASMIYSIREVRLAIEAIKKKALRFRDRVSLIVCKGFGAAIAQYPTTSFPLFLQKLNKVGLSDYTPLPVGMYEAYELALIERRRGFVPVIIIISDGNVNVMLNRPLPQHVRVFHLDRSFSDTLSVAKLIAKAKIDTVIINTKHMENVYQSLGDIVTGTDLMINVAKVTKGLYVAIRG